MLGVPPEYNIAEYCNLLTDQPPGTWANHLNPVDGSIGGRVFSMLYAFDLSKAAISVSIFVRSASISSTGLGGAYT